jgi:hypothetical protein
MRKLVIFATLLAALVLAAVVAACTGNEEAEPTATGTATAAAPSPTPTATPTATPSPTPTATPSPTPTPTPAPAGPTDAERAAAEPLLRAASLRAEDLPEGFTFAEERFVTNEQSIAEQLDYPGAPTLDDLNRWGQILEYEATYNREVPSILTGATLSLKETTVLYRDSAGADENFEVVRQHTTDPEYAKAQERKSAEEGQEMRDVEISPISFAKVAEDRMAFELTFTAYTSDLGKDLNYVAQLIGIRRGRAIGLIQVLAVGSPHPLEEVEDLARTLDERMKDALE